MGRFRSILSLFLVAIALLLVSCGNPNVNQGPTYTSEELQQIQEYTAEVLEMRDRMQSIPPLVQKQDWVNVESYIHGPLGELRSRMFRLARALEPKVQKQAIQTARDVFEHLNKIDLAAQERNSTLAYANYNEALKDFDTFLTYVPDTTNQET
jgi:photosystem II protein PsbQ